jgi:hypothetical protein
VPFFVPAAARCFSKTHQSVPGGSSENIHVFDGFENILRQQTLTPLRNGRKNPSAKTFSSRIARLENSPV